ncbi:MULTISPECIES: phage major capsid protein [Aminobacterium]|jgi:HK97 family phage major capsid protein|uniref:phage major capsid protein n=1 Tax=Aminobacterium TaxID=81466 RepID=UPI00257CDCF5|nr:phage major capsid protein [Aminobacterium sp. UBA4987]
MNIREMMEARATMVAEARKLLDTAEAEKRELSAEERAQYDKAFDEARKLGDKIQREQELREEERRLAEAGRLEPEGKKENPEERKLQAFRSFLINGNAAEYRALANDSDASGGFLHAAEQFVARLIKGLDNRVFVRQYATVLPVTGSDTLGVPTLTADPADPTWTTEIAAPSEDSTMAFGRRSLQPEQLSKLIKISMKLLRTSALPIENLVADRLAYKFAVAQENAFLNGDGDGEPLGIFTADANGINTDRDVSTGNSDTAVTADGLTEAKYALKAQYRGSARWIFHRDGVKKISKLKDGEGQYLWRPGITVGEPDILMGLPVDESEYVPTTWTTGLYVGALCNWSNYWIAELQGVELQRLVELYAGTSQIGFIGRMYADGAPVLAESFVRVKLG